MLTLGMKLGFLLAVLPCTARKLLEVPRGRLSTDLEGMEAMVLQLGHSSKSVYDDFRKLIREELRPRLRSERDTAQGLLAEAAQGFGLCPVQRVDVQPHRLCRLEELRLLQLVKEACNASASMRRVEDQRCKAFGDLDVFPEEAPLVCNKVEADATHEAHALRVRDFYAKKLEAVLAAQASCQQVQHRTLQLHGSCEVLRAKHRAQRETCNQLQRSLDDVACELWSEHAACEEGKSCLALARKRFLDANRTAADTEAELKTQWRAVQRIECLLYAMEQDAETERAMEVCRQQTHDGSTMSLSYPFSDSPMPGTCKKPSFPAPGSEGYAEVYALGASPAVAACTSECCGQCGYFTCSDGTVPKANATTLFGSSQEACCQLAPDPHWAAEEWPAAVCSTDCGLEAVTDRRAVRCWDRANQVELTAELCRGPAPAAQRVRCTATVSCRSCDALRCPGTLRTKATAALCAGAHCRVEECCDRACAASDCPAGSIVKPARCSNCSSTECCTKTRWSYKDWAPSRCNQTCGRPAEMETRRVVCTTLPLTTPMAGLKDDGQVVGDEACAGAKPATSRVRCPATPTCTLWAYAEWNATNAAECAARGCGLRELVEERAVVCNDASNGARLPDARCEGPKPATARTVCPATADCVLPSSLTCCPQGFILKDFRDLPGSCQQGECEVSACCSMVSWVTVDWDDTKECDRSCGLEEDIQERSVTCQAMYSGEVVNSSHCVAAAPAAQRRRCPATKPCESCSGVACGHDALPEPSPSCDGSSCNRQSCCRSFLVGFHADLPLTPNTVQNEGEAGGKLRFLGVPPKMGDGGYSFRLSGHTSMELSTMAGRFTALAYLKPHVADGSATNQSVLTGGHWSLSLSPSKQFQLSGPQGARSCSCPQAHEDVWAHVMVRDNGTALELAVNGKLCCFVSTFAAAEGATWLAQGLRADVHSVELWDGALKDEEVIRLSQRYLRAVPSWHAPQQLQCQGGLMKEIEGLESLAECKLRCADAAGCRSVAFDSGLCTLRRRYACPKCECSFSDTSLVANYDQGCRQVEGSFDWRVQVEAPGNLTELVFLSEFWQILKAPLIDQDGAEVVGCALSDGEPGGQGCKPPTGYWEYRFSKCSAPVFLSMALKDGSLDAIKVKVSFSTSSGSWRSCTPSPSRSGLFSRFRLDCFGAAPVAESPWWEH